MLGTYAFRLNFPSSWCSVRFRTIKQGKEWGKISLQMLKKICMLKVSTFYRDFFTVSAFLDK